MSSLGLKRDTVVKCRVEESKTHSDPSSRPGEAVT